LAQPATSAAANDANMRRRKGDKGIGAMKLDLKAVVRIQNFKPKDDGRPLPWK
jgi:hypothetical protein